MAGISSIPARSRGYSLIEVLVAFFVLSVGMLGVGGLHLTSLKDNRSALLRTQAIVLASDMFDRIRANTAAVDDYAVAASGDGVDNDCHATSLDSGSSCSATAMAQHDVYEWKRLISDVDDTGTEPPTALPGGSGAIAVNAVTTDLSTVTITIEWTEGQDAMSYSASTQVWQQ